MKLLRLWKQYDSVKAAVLLFAAALFFVGYCIRSAAAYAAYLRTPAEYICTAPAGIDKVLPQLAGAEGILAYSKQKSAYLESGQQGIEVTMLSPAYLADCFALPDESRTVFMNSAAFSAVFGDAQSPASFRGTRDGQPFSASGIRTDKLPQNEAFAVIAVSTAELHDADTLRICVTKQGAFSPESIGLTVVNRETQCAAEYEQKLMLLRIRFAALSAFLALLGAAAFLHICQED